ncbi:SagB/ThcOx family dehydrogenase [Pelomicrobium methylotrophicum]|uniref:SagB/ThcOx family dehydrogenase n=1 Tax=Pelomicrobium methylotrophicum TaxID=2602750 RepID=A0A5C7EYY6_9PROT|nr:SagB/ThcOx family dehydrogenase [Pelomicrobium methylotrophicum]TXF13786.1 SagB/ThcOx family dehydrogenase [Pelomicrobium methylotrophicum]
MKLESGVGNPLEEVLHYHEASKHHLDRYAPGPGGLDWANQPEPFRTYAGAEQVALPLAADRLQTPFDAVRCGARPEPRPLDRESLAILFELSLGLSAWKRYGGTRWALRCNPSSGNLHPTEAYLVCGELPGLARGVYHYVSRDHLLERRGIPGEAARWDRSFAGGVLVALTGIHWREAWKYGVRAWRYCQHDCGHAIGALAYAAAALGWRAQLRPEVGDDQLSALLGLGRLFDDEGAEPEAPEAVLWIGPGTPPAEGIEVPGEELRFAGRANRLSPAHVPWRGIEEVDLAARRPAGLAPPRREGAPLPPLASTGCGLSAAQLIRRRRSAVDFDGITSLPAERWFAMLDALLPRPEVPPLDAWPARPRVHLMIFVHRVEGVAPGLYAFVRDPEAGLRLRSALRDDWAWKRVEAAPAHVALYLLAEGDARDVARLVSCHQDIAADSCFALGFLAEFEEGLAAGPWRYRELYWETGLLGQILYLEAEAAGIRGTGIGCFFDDAMHQLLGLKDRSFQSLYHFTAGGPVEDPRLQTLPPYAHLRR